MRLLLAHLVNCQPEISLNYRRNNATHSGQTIANEISGFGRNYEWLKGYEKKLLTVMICENNGEMWRELSVTRNVDQFLI